MRTFELIVDLPFLEKGSQFVFQDDNAWVYAILDGEVAEYPLRTGLAAYLWLLLTDDGKYLKPVKEVEK